MSGSAVKCEASFLFNSNWILEVGVELLSIVSVFGKTNYWNYVLQQLGWMGRHWPLDEAHGRQRLEAAGPGQEAGHGKKY